MNLGIFYLKWIVSRWNRKLLLRYYSVVVLSDIFSFSSISQVVLVSRVIIVYSFFWKISGILLYSMLCSMLLNVLVNMLVISMIGVVCLFLCVIVQLIRVNVIRFSLFSIRKVWWKWCIQCVIQVVISVVQMVKLRYFGCFIQFSGQWFSMMLCSELLLSVVMQVMMIMLNRFMCCCLVDSVLVMVLVEMVMRQIRESSMGGFGYDKWGWNYV